MALTDCTVVNSCCSLSRVRVRPSTSLAVAAAFLFMRSVASLLALVSSIKFTKCLVGQQTP